MLQIDDRESPEVYDAFDKLGIAFEKSHLLIGDVVFDHTVCIERKEANDFVASIVDKRIISQVNDMQNNYDFCYLIIVGNPMSVFTGMHPNCIRGMIASITARTRIKIVRVDSNDEFAYMCKLLISKSLDGKSYTENKILKLNKTSIALRILTQIEGISEVRAKSLLEQFGSLKSIISANESELIKVIGIGKKSAENIITVFS